MLMQSPSKALIVKLGIIAFVLAVCVGATVQAWQASGGKAGGKTGDKTDGTANADMSSFIRDMHSNGQTQKLPVQVIDNYN
jgi:hypothetical protein